MAEAPFQELLQASRERGGLPTDDVLGIVLPLFAQVAGCHERQLVAPLHGVDGLVVREGALSLAAATGLPPRLQTRAVEALQRPVASVLHVVGEARIASDADSGVRVTDLSVLAEGEELTRPAYVAGYEVWERRLGHHDALTDVFALGQILASLACGLDFHDRDDLVRFAGCRDNLFALQAALHPVLAAVIVEMTELNRHRRATDVAALARRLQAYRDQPVELDVARIEGYAQGKLDDRRRLVLEHLRDRLFDLSRRNRLLYFRPTQASVNLTVASVPLVLDLRHLKADQLVVWNEKFAAELLGGEAIGLGKYLRFEDQPWLNGSLDKIIGDARRDRAEYGHSQLRLVIAFLRWHDLKQAPQERIDSPLLLLPVTLTRKKGVRDRYVLECSETVAEVNPALRYHLKQLYGVTLPETVDLTETKLEALHADLEAQIKAGEPGVTLRYCATPEIELVWHRASQRLEQWRRKTAIARQLPRPASSFDYSYEAEDWRPLGLMLFEAKVRPQPLPAGIAAGRTPDVRPQHMAPEPAVTERTTFAVREGSGGNPYTWDFDLCALTLGNFNYRKMSLVRDYGGLLEGADPCAAFDRVFTLEPKAVEPAAPPSLPRSEQWPVVQADASQSASVALARTGTDYIVQGPPGTGKSQSITNLIADYVARGKRVLFVCEKRAAIDVVFHRLRQQGLDELCCLIHDSQTDKKGFVLDLKQTYERWLAEEDQLDGLLAVRTAVLRQAGQDLEALSRFDTAMRSVPADVQAPLRELIGRLVALREVEPVLTSAEMERLPTAAEWRAHGELAVRLTAVLKETTGALTLASSAFRWLGPGVLTAEFPLATLTERGDKAQELLDRLDVGFEAIGLPAEHRDRITDLEALFTATARLQPVATRGQLDLLDANSALSVELRELADRLAAQVRQLAAAEEENEAWRDKLSASETQDALSQACAMEGSFLRLLRPAWWRLCRTLDQRYDFEQHEVQPMRSQVLKRLQAEHEALAAVAAVRAQSNQRFGASDPGELLAALQPLQSPVEPAMRAFCQLARGEGGAKVVQAMAELSPAFTSLLQVLDGLLLDWRSVGLSELGGIVRSLREDADVLPDLLLPLGDLLQAPPAFARALRTFDLSPDALEAATLRRGLEALYRTERWLPRFDAQVLARHVERLAGAERELLGHNAAVVRAQVRRNFRDHAQRATVVASQLDAEGKAWKKSYVSGRRDLEHEFGKTMRYKSIRDLAAGEPGMVVRDLKPVWLMSPLSVSDTLPLQAGLFDVVIFDEASQIPVEEAVPALWRAPQVIVVGDEMQLPPTSFFASGREEEEDDVGEAVAVLLEASSLLNQCARNLPATLLAWHYRSRSEQLIGFSNAAFYGGSLFTIPDQRLPAPGLPEIVVGEDFGTAAKADALLERPLSFHFVEHGVYDDRCNAREATYLAELVRELLLRQTGMSLGIVAFSEAQQTEIEGALDRLAASDPDFAIALEAEYVREEKDQFCGLFVKNLENVQGDERDVILLSICYGKGPDGRMQMNFGPINQRGGEKRLNVIFSRARRHMAVVSSIKDAAITNTWNDGAQALQGFLRYAEASSRGDAAGARSVLQGLNPGARKSLGAPSGDAVALQIAAAMRQRGFQVDEQVGQSRFRCDLALRKQDAAGYAAGVLIDNDEHYRNPDLLERYVTRPRLLAAFDWRVVQVLARDWYHEPDVVLQRIERLARGEKEVLPEVTVETPPEEPEPQAPGVVDASPAATAPPKTRRRFEFVDGTSRKFWEIGREQQNLTVRFGRIGTGGQTQTRTLASAERAERELQQLVAEKLKKGYRETS